VAVVALRQPGGHVTAQRSASSVGKQSTPTGTQSTKSSTRPGTSPTGTTSSAPRNGDSRSGASVKSVPLVILNNTTSQGLAQRAALRFESGGWTVTHYDNYQNVIISTCAYYDPSDPQAKPAAEALQAQFPTIKRIKPKFAELPSGPVVVVLTSDYSEN
jgi:hypothetical protein